MNECTFRTVEPNIDVPLPHISNEGVKVASLIAGATEGRRAKHCRRVTNGITGQFSERICEQIVDVSFPRVRVQERD